MRITVIARKDCPHKMKRKRYTKAGYTEACFGCNMLRKTVVTKTEDGKKIEVKGEWY
jgi:hypothetical protein